MKTSHSLIAATILLVGTLFSNAAPAQTSPRERTSIDDNWRFTKGNRIHFDIEGPGEIVQHLLPLRKFCDLGPAIYLDAAKYAERRLRDGITRSRVLYEAFYAYFLPQFEGVDETKAVELYRAVTERLDDPERREVHRNLTEVLGVELMH